MRFAVTDAPPNLLNLNTADAGVHLHVTDRGLALVGATKDVTVGHAGGDVPIMVLQHKYTFFK